MVGAYLGDAKNHVGDVGLECVDSAGLFDAAKPDANANVGATSLAGGLLHLLQLAGNVREVLGNLTSLALDSDLPGIHLARNCSSQTQHVSQASQQGEKATPTYHRPESGPSPLIAKSSFCLYLLY